ncbi:MAG: glycosyltransferase family 39 protein, partial [Planctomycetes bacterium]|nr:glycosyltransferase family 39 protein [Planctomycetota bacterium]
MARSTGLAALPADDQAAASPRPLGWVIPWVLAALVFGYFEAPRISEAQSPINWLLQADLDTLTYLGLLCAAPLAWWWHRPQRKSASPGLDRPSQWLSWFQPSVSDETPIPRIRLALLSLFIAGVSLGASATVGSRFENLPPAYHDEYSYLFQAQTFLAGRVSFPSSPAARLFDQMHVLNEGHFASRYFPGTGLWMAPFVAWGHPVWGHWLAGAICAVLMFWVARELAGDGAGIIAGLLTALSPAMALFSNLWLAHHPTLVGLSLFLFGYLRMIRTERWSWAMLAGGGLACAMLCRPMTAAGVALPFGIYLVAWAFFARPNTLSNAQSNPTTGRVPGNRRFQRLLLLAGLAFPLLAAGVGMFF